MVCRKDADGDGQVQMSEFATEWTDVLLDEFAQLDLNNDGIIVSEECLRAISRQNSEHTNQRFTIIPTKGVVRSVIEVAEKDTIADLDVQLQITHTHDDHLNVFLIGPEGQRVELFTNVGGQDDHFDGTILDEESPARDRPRPAAVPRTVADRGIDQGRQGAQAVLRDQHGRHLDAADRGQQRPSRSPAWLVADLPTARRRPPAAG